jgi:glycosyltransferase involved in cell wall biosynthesis
MAMPAFRSPTSLRPEGFGQYATPPSRKERLAIVSTSSTLCGIAAYTAALRRQLGDAFEITVFDLDQYLLRSPHRRVRKLADRHIKEICRAIRRFDVVNLQLEHGTLGRHGRDIYRRFCWLAAAAPRLSVTFHTLLLPPSFDAAAFMKALAFGRLKTALRLQADFHRTRLLACGIGRQLRRTQRKKQVSAIVHNRRDLYDASCLYGIRHVFDHPLSFLGAAEIDAIRGGASRQRFAMLDDLPPDAALVGVFGFLNEYKGIGTAIQALRYLPDNHHLLIFGGIHPHEIVSGRSRHPYIASLFDDAYMDTTLYDRMSAIGAQSDAPPLVVAADQGLRELLGAHPRDLSGIM